MLLSTHKESEVRMSEEKDYAYYSEALHSSYLFYTMEVDKLNKDNKRLREALLEIARIEPSPLFSYSSKDIDKICIIAEQALGGTCD